MGTYQKPNPRCQRLPGAIKELSPPIKPGQVTLGVVTGNRLSNYPWLMGHSCYRWGEANDENLNSSTSSHHMSRTRPARAISQGNICRCNEYLLLLLSIVGIGRGLHLSCAGREPGEGVSKGCVKRPCALP